MLRTVRFPAAVVLAAVVLAGWASPAAAREESGPYVLLQTGIVNRDIVEEDESIVGRRIKDDARSTRLLARVGFVAAGRVDVYAQGGAADLRIDDLNEYDAPFAGAYGGGLRVYLYRAPGRRALDVFAEANMLHYESDDEIEAIVGATPTELDEEIEWNEYAVMAGVAGWVENARPYGGVRLSRVDAEDRVRGAGFSEKLDIEEDDNFGVFGGVDFFLDRDRETAINLEVHLADENAFLIGFRVGY